MDLSLSQAIILHQRDKDIKPPTFEDFTKICRVCLHEISEPNTSKNVCEEECSMTIKSLLEFYAYAKIPETDDSLPQNVCSDCVDFLIDVHTFRVLFRKNEELLIKVRREAEESDNPQLKHHCSSNTRTDSSDSESLKENIVSEIHDDRVGLIKFKDCSLFCNKKNLDDYRKEDKHLPSRSLADDIRTYTKEKPFLGDLCKASFGTKYNLKKVDRRHNATGAAILDDLSLNQVPYQLLNAYENDIVRPECQVHTGEKPFTCEICKRGFAAPSTLRRHMDSHNGVNEHNCKQCDRRFINPSALRAHMAIHNNGAKRHKCPKCDCRFTHLSSLRRHMNMHNEIKPHKCEQCDRRFIRADHLRSHINIHNGRKAHICEECGRRFIQSSSLRRHMMIHI